jgi:hypothetical protein
MARIPRILIVEDDEIIANLIATMLQKKGYSIADKVVSGEEAVMKSAELEPDLIMMDINLCGYLDGIQAARYIFQIFQIPIIFLTGKYDDSIMERAKGSQPYGFIMKPFSDMELTTNVGFALHSHAIRKKFFDVFPVGSPKKLMAALDPVIITNPRGRIVFFNPYAARLLEIPPEQLLMSNFKNIATIQNFQTNEYIDELIEEVVKQMLVISYEFNIELITKTGRRRKVAITARPIKDSDDELLGVLVYIKEKTLAQIKMAQI